VAFDPYGRRLGSYYDDAENHQTEICDPSDNFGNLENIPREKRTRLRENNNKRLAR
jgi:hypothetical protein